MRRLTYFIGLMFLLSGWQSIHTDAQTPQPACTSSAQSTSRMLRATYPSQLLEQDMFYSIYLPPCYDATIRYPVIYLMHGSNSDDQLWQQIGLISILDEGIQSGLYPPMIVVMPFGNVIANRNRFDSISWANVFVGEFMPHIEANYAVSRERQQRAIGGISRGGFWAYHIALTYPELFLSVGGHSAFFDLYASPPEFNPLRLALSHPPLSDTRLWLDRGANDFARDGLDEMARRLQSGGIPHTYEIYAVGEHNNQYWQSHLADYIGFYAGGWNDIPSDVVGRLYVPVVFSTSLRTTLDDDQLSHILAGELNSNLILTEETYQALLDDAVQLSPQTRIVHPDALMSALFNERTQSTFTLVPFDQIPATARILLFNDRSIFDQLTSYPLFFSSSSRPNYHAQRLTRLAVSGVTALARLTLKALQDTSLMTAASGIAEYVRAVDFFHISNEVSFVEGCPDATQTVQLGGSNSLCSQWVHADLFDELGVDIIELTGNHNNDFGYEAYEETWSYYQERGYMTVGGGLTPEEARTPLEIVHHNNHIAWVACNAIGPYYALVNDDPMLTGGIRPGAASCSGEWLAELLPQLAQQFDVVILTIQHEEFETYVPNMQQQWDFQRYASLGADVVIGTAPHKPQVFEWVNNDDHLSFLHYGLGNLYFDQPFWGNMRFFIDTLIIYEGKLLTVELFPGIIDNNVMPRMMTSEERFNFLYVVLVEEFSNWTR